MSFERDLAAFAAKTEAKRRAVFVNTVSAVKDSIVNGSSVTGAPGQPVQTANLKDSWDHEFAAGGEAATIFTNVEYAPVIEDNVRGATLRSQVGGFHSVKLTVAGFDRLVQGEAEKVA